MRLNKPYEPHLVISDLALPPGEQWSPRSAGWIVLQITSGAGYWLHPKLTRQLEPGTVLVSSPEAQGQIRASQLNGVSLRFFHVCPERLVEVMTFNEQRFLGAASSREEHSVKIFQPPSVVTAAMTGVCASPHPGGAATRLQLLQIFVEVFRVELEREKLEPTAAPDARERLSDFLRQTPASELLHISLAEMVQATRCTPRHFSRIFRDVVGMSFREKQAELRLGRACKLLVATESKVVDVALESGYQSLSLFNLMFTRRFGLSPGKWRRRNLEKNRRFQPRRRALATECA